MQLNFTRRVFKSIAKEYLSKISQISLCFALLLSAISCGLKDGEVKIRLVDANGKAKRAKIRVPKFNKQILEQINAENKEKAKSDQFSQAKEIEKLPKIDNINIDNQNQINKVNNDIKVDFAKNSSDNIDNIFVAKKQQSEFNKIESGDLSILSQNNQDKPNYNKNKIRKIQPSVANIQEIPVEEQESIDLKSSNSQPLQKDQLSPTQDVESGSKLKFKKNNLKSKVANSKFSFANDEDKKNLVQVGVFSNMANAKKSLAKNKKFGNTKIVLQKNGKNNIYKVVVGPFKNNSQAVKIAEKIKNSGGEAVLVK